MPRRSSPKCNGGCGVQSIVGPRRRARKRNGGWKSRSSSVRGTSGCSGRWRGTRRSGRCEWVGQWRKAVAEMRALLRRSPRHASALNFVGYTLAEHGAELDLAGRLVVASLALRPLDGYVLDSLGWVYFKTGRLELARDTLEKANRLAPGEPEILKHL